jgi:hypothetical protein
MPYPIFVSSPAARAGRLAAIQAALDADVTMTGAMVVPDVQVSDNWPPQDIDLGPWPETPPPSRNLSPDTSYHTPAITNHTPSVESVPPDAPVPPNFSTLTEDDLLDMITKIGYDPDPVVPLQCRNAEHRHYAQPIPGRPLLPNQKLDDALKGLFTLPTAEQSVRLSHALVNLDNEGITQDVRRYQTWYHCVAKLKVFQREARCIYLERHLELTCIANRLVNADAYDRLLPHLAYPHVINIRTGGLRGGSNRQPMRSNQSHTPRAPKCWFCKERGHRQRDCVQYIASQTTQTPRPRRPSRQTAV